MTPSGGLNRAIGDLAFADRICVTSILEQVDARRRLSLLFSQQVDRVRPTERRLRGGRGKRNGRKANREGCDSMQCCPPRVRWRLMLRHCEREIRDQVGAIHDRMLLSVRHVFNVIFDI